MKLINLTRSNLKIANTMYPAAQNNAWCPIDTLHDGEFNGIPIVRNIPREPAGLPPPVEGVFYLVSFIVLNNCKRPDLLAFKGEARRDKHTSYIEVDCLMRR